MPETPCHIPSNSFRNVGVAVGGVLTSLSNSRSQVFQDIDGIVPVNARICDTDPLLQSGWSLGWNFLVALIDVRFNHDTNDRSLSGFQLVTNNLGNLGLISVIFVRVTCLKLVVFPNIAQGDSPCEQSIMIACF